MHFQATTAELAGGLNEQIEAVDDEVELWDGALLLVVVGQVLDVVVGEGGLSAALGVPDDAPCACLPGGRLQSLWSRKSAGSA